MLIKMITYINMIYLKSIIMGNDMEHIKSKKDSTGGTWDTYKTGNTKIQTHTTKKGDVAVFCNNKKINKKSK